jgi:hypothetical protein
VELKSGVSWLTPHPNPLGVNELVKNKKANEFIEKKREKEKNVK